VAAGPQEAHEQKRWIYDALALDSIIMDSHRSLVGIQLENVSTSVFAQQDLR